MTFISNAESETKENFIYKLAIIQVLHLLGPSDYIMMCQNLFSSRKFVQFYELCIENRHVKENFQILEVCDKQIFPQKFCTDCFYYNITFICKS